jgi:signal transduction histidine kinase
MLAFVVPLAVLVERQADSAAVVAATTRGQSVVPLVASGDDTAGQAAADVTGDGFEVLVRLPDGSTVGAPDGTWAPAGDEDLRATRVRRLPDGGAVVDQPVVREDGTAVISARVNQEILDHGVVRAWAVLALLGVMLVAISLFVADRLARSMTRPVSDLAEAADRLGHGDLTTTVDPAGPPEIRDVGTAMNTLARRITRLLAAERESVADISHRLRTPVAALRLDAGSLADPEERARITADVDALVEQVDAVIERAKRPVHEERETPPECDIVPVVADRMAFWKLLADEENRPFAVSHPERPVLVRANADDVAAALDALLDNVFAHTPEGTGFSVSVRARAEGGALLEVSDMGPGFGDKAVLGRGASGAGSSGLGLDIARRLATDSGGQAQVSSTAAGTSIVLRLPGPDPDRAQGKASLR